MTPASAYGRLDAVAKCRRLVFPSRIAMTADVSGTINPAARVRRYSPS